MKRDRQGDDEGEAEGAAQRARTAQQQQQYAEQEDEWLHVAEQRELPLGEWLPLEGWLHDVERRELPVQQQELPLEGWLQHELPLEGWFHDPRDLPVQQQQYAAYADAEHTAAQVAQRARAAQQQPQYAEKKEDFNTWLAQAVEQEQEAERNGSDVALLEALRTALEVLREAEGRARAAVEHAQQDLSRLWEWVLQTTYHIEADAKCRAHEVYRHLWNAWMTPTRQRLLGFSKQWVHLEVYDLHESLREALNSLDRIVRASTLIGFPLMLQMLLKRSALSIHNAKDVQGCFDATFKLCTSEMERDVYDSVVQLFRLVSAYLPEVFNIRYARFLSQEQRNTVYALLLTFKRLEHGKMIPKTLALKIAWLSFGGKLNPVFDARKGAKTVIRACEYLTRFWLPNQRNAGEEDFVWGDELIQQFFA